jgi:hypothetical protein
MVTKKEKAVLFFGSETLDKEQIPGDLTRSTQLPDTW